MGKLSIDDIGTKVISGAYISSAIPGEVPEQKKLQNVQKDYVRVMIIRWEKCYS